MISLLNCIISACTGVLWWTYATIKWDLDAKPINTWLIRTVHNEQAFLIFSIVATILTVSPNRN